MQILDIWTNWPRPVVFLAVPPLAVRVIEYYSLEIDQLPPCSSCLLGSCVSVPSASVRSGSSAGPSTLTGHHSAMEHLFVA